MLVFDFSMCYSSFPAIHLDENQFETTLPEIFDYIYRVREFHVQKNSLYGSIPTLSHLKSLSKSMSVLTVYSVDEEIHLTQNDLTILLILDEHRKTISGTQSAEFNHS